MAKSQFSDNGVIIWAGPSLIDGAPIIVVATGLTKSRNKKTGNTLQTWIIRADMSPIDAINSGADISICGNCKHRGKVIDGRVKDRPCYVNVSQAPQSVYRTLLNGRYAVATDIAAVGRGRVVRLGSYGDPAAVPLWVWELLCSESESNTGYTHQWSRFPDLAKLCMASCDSEAELLMAVALGFRSFRVRRPSDLILRGEVQCPASKEMGNKTTCALCRACGGNSAKARANITIIAHGRGAKAFERFADAA